MLSKLLLLGKLDRAACFKTMNIRLLCYKTYRKYRCQNIIYDMKMAGRIRRGISKADCRGLGEARGGYRNGNQI